jgi:hypothetical protein
MNNTGETYLQFPLCSLTFGADEWERLETIISFGFVEAGFTFLHRLTPDIRQMKAAELARASDTPSDYRHTKPAHVAAMLGARAIGITVGSVACSMQRWETLADFRQQFEREHGRDAEARIARGLVFEARDKQGISYREFAVLCAIYSCIGGKQYPVRITRQMIQCRMLGYKSPDVMRSEIANRLDGAKPLTLRQINYTVDALHERQFFARARANRRQTFFSNRMTQDELESALIKSKTYSEGFHQRRRQRDAALIEQIKELRAAY